MGSPTGIQVPKGGSHCSNCMYVSGNVCKNRDWIGTDEGFKKDGDDRFVDSVTGEIHPAAEFCCSFYDWKGRPKPGDALDVYAKRLARKKEG